MTRPLDASLKIYEADSATSLLIFLQYEADYGAILPLFLQYEAASAANLPVSLLYEVDCAAIRLHIMSTIPILTFLMLYETDFADFLLYIPYILLEYGSDYIAGLTVYTLSDASTWTCHYW